MQVIHEMQSEIIKLVQENQTLRGELQFGGQKETKQEEGTRENTQKEESWSLSNSDEEATGSLVPLRRSVSAGSALTLQEQKGTMQLKLPMNNMWLLGSSFSFVKVRETRPSGLLFW